MIPNFKAIKCNIVFYFQVPYGFKIFFYYVIFLREFQSITSTVDNSFLSLDQDTNQFLM